MLLYFFKIVFLSGLFYSLFKGMLANKICFRFNRRYILASVLLAAMLPWLNAVGIFNPTGIQEYGPIKEVLTQVTVSSAQLNRTELGISHILLAIYALGILWGLARMALGAYILRKLYQTGQSENGLQYKIVRHLQIEHPFSFWGFIFLPIKTYSEEEEKAILRHEEIHVQQLHSLEKIILTMLQTFFWFNPFFYLFHRELELQHEFEADAGTISRISRDAYLNFLSQQIQTSQVPTLLVQPFFQHPLKTRIHMMFQQNSSTKMMRLAAVVGLVVLATCFVSFQSMAQPHSKPVNSISEQTNNTNHSNTLPEFPGGQEALIRFLTEKIKYPESDRQAKREGKTVVSFIVNESGVILSPAIAKSSGSEAMDREALRVLALMPAWKPGTMNGKAVKVEFKLPISFVLK